MSKQNQETKSIYNSDLVNTAFNYDTDTGDCSTKTTYWTYTTAGSSKDYVWVNPNTPTTYPWSPGKIKIYPEVDENDKYVFDKKESVPDLEKVLRAVEIKDEVLDAITQYLGNMLKLIMEAVKAGIFDDTSLYIKLVTAIEIRDIDEIKRIHKLIEEKMVL